jgi:hypothetical protein
LHSSKVGVRIRPEESLKHVVAYDTTMFHPHGIMERKLEGSYIQMSKSMPRDAASETTGSRY